MRECPKEEPFNGDHHARNLPKGQVPGENQDVTFHNSLADDVSLFWVRPNTGVEMLAAMIAAGTSEEHHSHVGHIFRARDEGGMLIQEVVVTKPDRGAFRATITPCGESEKASLPACPDEIINLRSKAGQPNPAEVTFKNDLAEDVNIYWMTDNGIESFRNAVEPNGESIHNSHIGHAFRVRTGSTGALVHVVTVNKAKMTVYLAPCAEGKDSKLVTDEQPSDKMPGNVLYKTADDTYVAHIPKMPKISKGPGWLKMDMPDGLAEFLKNFWDKEKGRSLVRHESIGGGYTNQEVVPMDKVDLDFFTPTRFEIVKKMRPILQWWTNRRLVHTATYGLRIYRRDSMLLTHVDRAETHLASAILQIDQKSDEGWPLEVLTPAGDPFEVFLRAGEMLLYEGGRIRHGRPARYNGSEFVNVFTHFCPLDWQGPNKY
ncbi:hypothetical protein CYMTET_38820 [Cymbomonas tetramitiformis]|uniref:Uncharacterized protein n=1 Tax=Cymbomonas tetramitiformis TaxID=36881 RepID=A0AAE0F4W1_9CHLO|nr:hypothetical protein CYMTET_38820 [Cymbomonas tetramitiformis]|eukprot:gene17582-20934_t